MTPAEAVRSMSVDPQVTRLMDHHRRENEAQHVAQIVGHLGDLSRVPSIELPFADGTYRFRLTELEMVLLELGYAHPSSSRETKAPPMRIGEAYARLLRGRYTIDGEDVGVPGGADFSVIELNALIRMALIGGGGGTTTDGRTVTWADRDPEQLMADYVFPLPLMERWDMALAVLGARVEGGAAAADSA